MRPQSQATTIIRRTSRFHSHRPRRWGTHLVRAFVIVLTLVVVAIGFWGVAG